MTSLDTEETSRVVYDAKAQGSSSMMVRSDEEPNSSNRCEAGVTAEDLALVEFNSVEEAYARLESIEKAVSKVYMREIFFEVKKKIEWCKDAKSLVSVGVVPVANTEKAFQVRYGSLWSACMSMFFLAAQNGNMYENVLSQVEKLTKKIEPAGPQGGRNRFGREGDDHVNMLDPTIIKSNGAPRGSMNVKMGRRCRRCHGLGHDHRNCTARNKQPDDEGAETINRQSQTSCKRVRRG
ncbi:hypothetical protein Ahy_B08g089723 [Arachis hypogaea]|uniref:CCHC-type domain-containing protein n=1 Tax=Arachis hypogaea TaxID=3818 RepID=A0A444XYQ0_ARAHY|nr:hypothetical protein Ahy_B08g089723 [Arachis hypogaea]